MTPKPQPTPIAAAPAAAPQPQEIELKLLVVGLNAAQALQQLVRAPSLARRKPERRWLVNRYFDTPDQQLRQQRCALRLRQSLSAPPTPKSAQSAPWQQTLKTAGQSHGGLSQRGEWNVEVPCGQLQRSALHGTAWETLDPQDTWFAQLEPCFETRCERTIWRVRRRDGTVIEVAFDAASVVAAGHSTSLLELELELLQGNPSALFALAQELAQRLPCLPSNRSKAERAQALADGTLYSATKAQRLVMTPREPVHQLAQRAMADMLDQFTRNLDGVLHSDAPELVHQARVGWRRWRSMEKLLRPWLGTRPDWTALRPLLLALGQQRNLDVAGTETLPHWAAAWPGEPSAWSDGAERITQARLAQREAVRQALATPATGLALLQLSEALWHMGHAGTTFKKKETRLRLARWHRKLQQLLAASQHRHIDLESLHQARLLAKRLRYGSEALASSLSRKHLRLAERWLAQATEWQTRIGLARDAWQAAACLREVGAPDSLVFFLQGVGASLDRQAQSLANQNARKAAPEH